MDPTTNEPLEEEVPWLLTTFLSIPEEELNDVRGQPDWHKERRDNPKPLDMQFDKTVRPKVIIRSNRYTDVFFESKKCLWNKSYV